MNASAFLLVLTLAPVGQGEPALFEYDTRPTLEACAQQAKDLLATRRAGSARPTTACIDTRTGQVYQVGP